jgi:hypothetical protein
VNQKSPLKRAGPSGAGGKSSAFNPKGSKFVPFILQLVTVLRGAVPVPRKVGRFARNIAPTQSSHARLGVGSDIHARASQVPLSSLSSCTPSRPLVSSAGSTATTRRADDTPLPALSSKLFDGQPGTWSDGNDTKLGLGVAGRRPQTVA